MANGNVAANFQVHKNMIVSSFMRKITGIFYRLLIQNANRDYAKDIKINHVLYFF
jgi:hypothetical protein